MNYKDVELSDGRVVRVHRPPNQRIHFIVTKRYPYKPNPIKKEKTASGGEIAIEVVDDPETIRHNEEMDVKRAELADELTMLFAFKDLKVPPDFDLLGEYGELIAHSGVDVQPRQGDGGRKLDYIEWDLMGDTGNAMRISNALAELCGISLEATDLIGESFPGAMEGQAA